MEARKENHTILQWIIGLLVLRKVPSARRQHSQRGLCQPLPGSRAAEAGRRLKRTQFLVTFWARPPHFLGNGPKLNLFHAAADLEDGEGLGHFFFACMPIRHLPPARAEPCPPRSPRAKEEPPILPPGLSLSCCRASKSSSCLLRTCRVLCFQSPTYLPPFPPPDLLIPPPWGETSLTPSVAAEILRPSLIQKGLVQLSCPSFRLGLFTFLPGLCAVSSLHPLPRLSCCIPSSWPRLSNTES